MSVGNALQTAIESYKLVFTGDFKVVDNNPGTGGNPYFPLGITSGDIDLNDVVWGGKGTETKANRLEMIVTGNDAGAATMIITGACEGGPEEYICSVAMTFGGTLESLGGWVWCQSMELTSYHLSACSILVADVADTRPSKLGFDAIGYRYIRFYSSAFGGNIGSYHVYARYF